MVFKTWDLNFGAWEILGYGFQDMVFRTWDLKLSCGVYLSVVTNRAGQGRAARAAAAWGWMF